VRFDERGDREQLTANIQLYNVLQATNGANGTHVAALVASYQGTREVPWLWQGGSMSASGVVFNGGADTPPKDIAPASSSTSPFPFLIGFGCLFGVLFVLVGVYLLAKYKKGKIAEGKRRKTEEDLAKARADALRERNLMAIIFHELRNPLNGVVAHLRLGSQAPAESAERLQSALVCTEHALSFLNGLSQIEKLEASAATALRFEPCSLYEVVQSVITIVSPQLKPGVKMLTTLPPPTLQVELDRTVLAQVLINLLQNAAANTSSGFVELECYAAPNSSSDAFVEVALVVRDTGQGMSKEVQTKIFDRYQSVGGIGLGMYLTKLQIQQMGSSISVQSPWTGPNGEQSGAKFSFNLHLKVASPLPKVASQAARTLPVEVDLLPEPQLPRQLRVLIADDVKMNRKLLRAALSRHCCSEWEIDEAATAEAAVAEMSSTIDSRYDLVLMDDHFEVDGSGAKPSKMGAWEHDPSLVAMRGSEAIAYIRAFELQNPSLRPAVLIMCTGASLDVDASWRKHADAVWGKPFPDFTNNTMQRSLSELLRKRPNVSTVS
jgi:signal transduction histidine kinase/CheY-like chemotaxis protein